MMFFNVITISLITICSAHRMFLSEVTSSKKEVAPHAIPYNGHVIYPKMFKYATIAQHSTPSSKSRSVRKALTGNMLWKLQYAPLQGVSSRYKNSDEAYTIPTPTHSNVPVEPTKWLQDKKVRRYGKSHLEPRTETIDKKCYAKGYNKPDALESAFRSPGHNAVYTRLSYNEHTISEPNLSEPVGRKPVISKYDKPIGINLDLQSLQSTTYTPFIDLNSDGRHNMPLTLTQEHFVINPNTLETEVPIQDKKKRYSSHSKYHRLHLNVARVYSPGQVPPKVPAYAHAYADNLARSPPKPQVYVPQAIKESSKNTLLFPIKKHRKGNFRSHTSIINYN